MSAEIINLRQVRKRKSRAEKEKTAGDNRLKYGRSKSERDIARKRRKSLEKDVDNHKLASGQSDVPDDPSSSGERD